MANISKCVIRAIHTAAKTQQIYSLGNIDVREIVFHEETDVQRIFIFSAES